MQMKHAADEQYYLLSTKVTVIFVGISEKN